MIAVAFLSSAIAVDNSPAVGNKAPEIETISGINVANDANSESKGKLISFWNPKVPASRIANKKFNETYAGSNNENIDFISISTDKDDNLSREILKLDGINPDQSFAYSEISERVFKDYDVETSPRAFLISPDGKISAIM